MLNTSPMPKSLSKTLSRVPLASGQTKRSRFVGVCVVVVVVVVVVVAVVGLHLTTKFCFSNPILFNLYYSQEAAAQVKRVAADLKKSIPDFFRDEKRPNLRLIHDGMLQNPQLCSSEPLHVIPRHFASQLERFLKSPATDNRPVSMSSILLLCKHKKMMYNLEASCG